VLTSDEHAQFQRLIERRRGGEPVAYLTGSREFWSLQLDVNSSVLVPRPETELLVERALLHLQDRSARVVDLGTGSGAIALAIAHERPSIEVWATDASPDALELAARNACKLGSTHVTFKLGDWLSALPRERFDLIVSNPPYIAAGDRDLAPNVLAYEPYRALISGATGFEAIETIVAAAPSHLHEGGWLLLEHGLHQAPRVRSLLEQVGFTSVASHADLAGIERVSEGQWLRSHQRRDRHT
jgi:release factor glutamine methyltransferase